MPKCGFCGKEFSTDAALAQHVSDKHGKEALPAEIEARAETKERKSLRKRNRHPVVIGVGIALVLLAGGLYYAVSPSFAPTPFPCAVGESYIHVHPYLSIVINGEPVVIPDGVGSFRGGDCLMPIHTHDDSGYLHIELGPSDQNQNFTLGDFFTIWAKTPGNVAPTLNGVSLPIEFTKDNIFGFHADSTHRVVTLVNDTAVNNPTMLPLEQLDYLPSPIWKGVTYPYGTGHTIVIEYITNSTG